MRQRAAKNGRRIPKTTIAVTREQHARYRNALLRSELRPDVFMERLLAFAESTLIPDQPASLSA